MIKKDSISADGSWTFKTLTYPKIDEVAPIEIFFSVVANIANAKIEVLLGIQNQIGTISQGFLFESGRNYICKIKKLADSSDVPCLLTCDTVSSSMLCTALAYSQITLVIIFHFLQKHFFFFKNTDYQLTLTSLYDSTSTGDGIKFPSNVGVFEVSVTVYDSTTKLYGDCRYIEIYPASFTLISLKGFVPGSSEKNPIEINFKPSVSITTSHYLVIEIPTKSSAGNMFSDDIGLGITKNNQAITLDEISNNYISSLIL